MKIRLLAVGTRMPDWVTSGYDDYAKRFPPELKVELKAVKTEPRGSKSLETLYAAERERIEEINRSLREIDYNPGRLIQLEAQSSGDGEIAEFRASLRACTEGSLSGSGDEQYAEGKFLEVRRIIERFRGREGLSDQDRRWTRKVCDVRNWFGFSASERWREDGSEHEHYSDSGGKSGGQKEKLAYTVLAASLAYRFGLEWGVTRSRSFRFVVIDEALTAKLKALSQRHGTTLYMTLLSSWAVLLSRLSGQDDIVIGSPTAGRNRSEVEGLIGMFVNTVVLRTPVDAQHTFAEHLTRVRDRDLDALAQAVLDTAADAGARWLSVEASLVRDFGDWSVQAGWRQTVAGRETPLTRGPVLALWRRF